MNRMVKTAAVLLAAASGALHAQTWPAKPIKVVIPFVAGGSSDIVGRAIAAKFQDYLGQPGVVENKPGANGAIAAEPAKTPREIVAKLNEASVRALHDATIKERMTQIGFDVVAGTPEEFGKFMKAEVDRWTTVVNKGGIKPE